MLLAGDVGAALTGLKTLLVEATDSDVASWLAEAPPPEQARLAMLLRDLLAQYPATLIGIPAIVYWLPRAALAAQSAYAPLPVPEPAERKPCVDIEFLGWSTPEQSLLNPLPAPSPPWVTADRPTVAVALFKSSPDAHEHADFVIPSHWWWDFMEQMGGYVQVTAKTYHPYPDAFEIARLMQARLWGRPEPKAYFISDLCAQAAREQTTLFLDSCLAARRAPGRMARTMDTDI